MFHRKLHRLVAAGIAAILVLSVTPGASASVAASPAPGTETLEGYEAGPLDPQEPPAHDDANVAPAFGVAPGAAAESSVPSYWYGTRGDYVHRSGSDLSAHGWWVNHSLPPGTLANVDIKLQVLHPTFGWLDITGWFSKNVAAGGGSANRVTARYTCSGSTYNYFRSVVDVDILGYSDPDNKLYTSQRWLPC
jgi:hypothetical protein